VRPAVPRMRRRMPVALGRTGLPLSRRRVRLARALSAPPVGPGCAVAMLGAAVSPVAATAAIAPLRGVAVPPLTRIGRGGALLRRDPRRLAGARGRACSPGVVAMR